MSATTTKSKRGPTVLVTDAREQQPHRRPGSVQGPASSPRTKLISVDNILQYASEIPSGQRRGPPDQRPRPSNRTASGKPADPRLSGRLLPAHIPARSSKVSEKLVLLPEAEGLDDDELQLEEDEAPPDDAKIERMKSGVPMGLKEKSYAERLPKASRTEKLARVTAYCTAQGYKLKATAEFLKTQHQARTKLYDDCLYAVYHLRLLPGTDGYRVKSAPVIKSPGGKSVLDEEIERNEQGIGRDGYFNDEDHGVGAREDGSPESPDDRDRESRSDSSRRSLSPKRIPPDALSFGEMFIFSYGVVVFWNFTEAQEKDILADTTFAEQDTGVSLVSRPQPEEDFEMEEFHFEYNPQIPRPRMFNDMITLKSGDHMIKLAMSHAIAQSTKLCFFEERMAHTMLEVQHVPRRLALTGKLGMDREEVVKMLGRLFTSRVEVNLSSNVLDVPNFFWESEPTLHALYVAVREYLEIKPRIQVLNERCKVFLDLAEILSDSIADKKMTRITWIIIYLIILSIIVTCSEVFLRFGILAGSRGKEAKIIDPSLPA